MTTRMKPHDTAMASNHHGVPRKRPSKSLRSQQPKQEENVDDSAWIHRDKLAAIEFQELEEAGLHVRQPHRADSVGQSGGRTTRSSSTSVSRSGVRKAQSRDVLGESHAEEEMPYLNGQEDYERKRISTIRAAEEEEVYYEQSFNPYIHSEIRTPEEVAAENNTFRQQHVLRPSTSRIPISKSSAAHASSNAADRDSQSPGNNDGIPTTWEDLKRMRSGSVGSGILLDDADISHEMHTFPEQGAEIPLSPSKSKVPGRDNAMGSRRNGQRSASAQRPISSSGHAKRPTTSHNRPEGEAPWIATMYKPDPRLPPDQQLLPTHAKRMMQEQWEREGKVSSTYEHDTLNGEEEVKQPPSPQTETKSDPIAFTPVVPDKENIPPAMTTEMPTGWPLTSYAEEKSETGSPRPGSYRITPKIAPSPSPQRSPIAQSHAAAAAVELPATEKAPIRLPDYDEKDDRAPKKGCCCIVM